MTQNGELREFDPWFSLLLPQTIKKNPTIPRSSVDFYLIGKLEW